jgi:hypothetical protein
MPSDKYPNYFSRRNYLGLACDVTYGALKSAQTGLFGQLFLTAAGTVVIGSSLLAITMACAAGGAIASIPALMLREQLNINRPNSNFLLQIASDTTFRMAFAFGAGMIGALIMGLAATPLALTAMTAPFVFGVFNAIFTTILRLGATFKTEFEDREDAFAVTKL